MRWHLVDGRPVRSLVAGGGEPAPKVSYVTKIGDQICGVGYYK